MKLRHYLHAHAYGGLIDHATLVVEDDASTTFELLPCGEIKAHIVADDLRVAINALDEISALWQVGFHRDGPCKNPECAGCRKIFPRSRMEVV